MLLTRSCQKNPLSKWPLLSYKVKNRFVENFLEGHASSLDVRIALRVVEGLINLLIRDV